MELIRKMGVKFRLGVDENFSEEKLKREGFKYVFIAIGAWKPGLLKLESCNREIINVLEFLEAYKNNRAGLKPGKTVVIVGAGNSAMDAARSAKRLPGVENVYIVYRRTQKYMPADREELKLALKEGVEFKELLTPVSFLDGVVKCGRMELGAPDSSGRRSPVAIPGEYVEIKATCIIAAVGEQVETPLLVHNKIELDSNGRIKVNAQTNETSVAGVYAGGDAVRGPASIVEGIADGTKFAEIVFAQEGLVKKPESTGRIDRPKQTAEIRNKKGVLKNTCRPEEEYNRCLECNNLCNSCVEVCPNRANLAVSVNRQYQVLHMEGMCNECGNCETFCPYDSAPYKDKFTLYWNRQDFEDSNNSGFVTEDKASGSFTVRLGGKITEVSFDESGKCSGDLPKEIADLIWTVYNNYPYIFMEV
jgi:putative selenate reductase